MNGEQIPENREPNADRVASLPEIQPVSAEDRMSAFERSTVRLTRNSIRSLAHDCGVSSLRPVVGDAYERHRYSRPRRQPLISRRARPQSFATSASQIDAKIGQAEADFARIAKDSEAAIKATQEEARLDQRAWIAPKGVYLTAPVEPGVPIKFNVQFENVGSATSNASAAHLHDRANRRRSI